MTKHDDLRFWPEDDPSLPPPGRGRSLILDALVCGFIVIIALLVLHFFGDLSYPQAP